MPTTSITTLYQIQPPRHGTLTVPLRTTSSTSLLKLKESTI